MPIAEFVLERARKAHELGADGVIAAPTEVAGLREIAGPEEFLIVTPGIRPAGASRDDQKRIGTPTEAILAGADYLVVGRADHPRPRARKGSASHRRRDGPGLPGPARWRLNGG